MRFLAVGFGLLLFGSTASAQAFKPRGGAAKTTAAPAKKSTPAKKSAAKAAPASTDDSEDSDDSDDKPAKAKKSAAKTSASKSRTSKKSRAAKDGRPDDLTPAPAGKHDPDFVLITDDDE